ncbi:MAG: DUF4339 domain-containing protein [Gammaproteobacteria bacterium]|nr:DUF4339 domain-containing protein [Gammaproteobacteria bacterium]
MMQGKSWYFSRNGRVEGPFSEAQLIERVSSGEGYSVWNLTLAKWIPARAWLDTLSANQADFNPTPRVSSDPQMMTNNFDKTNSNQNQVQAAKRKSVPVVNDPVAQFKLQWAKMEKRHLQERKALLNEWMKIKRNSAQAVQAVCSEKPRAVDSKSVKMKAPSVQARSTKVTAPTAKPMQRPSLQQNNVRTLPVNTAQTAVSEQASAKSEPDNISAMDQEIRLTQSRVEELQKSLQQLSQSPSVAAASSLASDDDMMKRVARRRRRRAR